VPPAEGGDMEQALHLDREMAAAGGIQAPNPEKDTCLDAKLDQGNLEADTQSEWRGTPIEEEPWNEATHTTWPGYKPYV
jgi:hypothetical protein